MRTFTLALAVSALGTWWLAATKPAVDPITFVDRAVPAGIDFILRNSATPEKHQIETMISGVAVFDYNNDGKPDIYFVNGAAIPKLEKTDSSYRNRLYRNNGDGTFTDVTAQAGVSGAGYGMGVAAGDFDNDGNVDLFLPGVNRNILYRNRGDNTFEDVTAKAHLEGIDSQLGKVWSIAAGWFDYDNDGFLDLFVVNYVVWDPKKEHYCGVPEANVRTYCHPKYYQGLANTLYHNNGDGTFTDVSKTSGIAAYVGKGMGVAFADYDHDGLMDVFVANDTMPNFLFHNEGGGEFREVGLRSGVALNDDGRAVSAMGADFRDYNNDGWDDLFVTALAGETFPLFRNRGKGLFEDTTHSSRVGRAVARWSGWSNGIVDLNNDGFKDLFVARGDVQDNAEATSSRKTLEPNSVLANQGDGTFADVSVQAGESFQQAGQHRGAAFGDFDGDGRVDVVVTRLNGRAELFRNTSPARNHWLGLKLVGRRSNRDGIGARVHIVSSSGAEQWNHVTTSVGFACSSDRILHFGLGKDAFLKRVEIVWPSGTRQELENPTPDGLLTVVEPNSSASRP
jgi:hypothetical protein